MLNSHWEQFYKHFNEIEPSNFAQSLKLKGKIIVDLGCGNGRDSYYFGKNNQVVGVDVAIKNQDNENIRFFQADINDFIKWGYKADVIYCRFLFHSIDEETEDNILEYAKKIKAKLCIETRIRGDKPTLYKNHVRREIDPIKFLKKLSKLGFACEITSGQGLAKYKDEDPLILRVICNCQ